MLFNKVLSILIKNKNKNEDIYLNDAAARYS